MESQELHSPVATSYAKAILDLATQPGQAESVGDELSALRQVIINEPLAAALLADPAIGYEERDKMLDRVFAGRVSDLVLKFLHVLNEKGRLSELSAIAVVYARLLEDREGKIEVDATVAARLDNVAFERVRQRIGSALKREVVLHQYVDERILGGMVLRVGDKMIDASVRTQLAAIREKMLAAKQ